MDASHGLDLTRNVLAAAREARVQRIVTQSSIGAGLDPMPIMGRRFAAREVMIRESGMTWTFLCPSYLMSNALWSDYAMRIKGISSSTQAPFRQAGFLSPFCWRYTEQDDGSDPFIQALFWRPAPLLEQMIVVRSLPAFSFGLWHRSNSMVEAKETRLGASFARSMILQICYWKSPITAMICSEHRKVFPPS